MLMHKKLAHFNEYNYVFISKLENLIKKYKKYKIHMIEPYGWTDAVKMNNCTKNQAI